MASIVDQLLGEFDISYIARRLDYTTDFTRAVLEGDRAMSATFEAKLLEFNGDAKYNRLRRAGAPVDIAEQLSNRSWSTVNDAVGVFDQVIGLTAANKNLDYKDVKKAIAGYGNKSYQEYQDIANQGGSA